MDFGVTYFPTDESVEPDELPSEYKRIHDPFVSLGTMAAATENPMG